MAVGLLESFDFIHSYGSKAVKDGAIDSGDILFCAGAWNRKGCRTYASKLTKEDIQRVIEIGKRIKAWKAEQR